VILLQWQRLWNKVTSVSAPASAPCSGPRCHACPVVHRLPAAKRRLAWQEHYDDSMSPLLPLRQAGMCAHPSGKQPQPWRRAAVISSWPAASGQSSKLEPGCVRQVQQRRAVRRAIRLMTPCLAVACMLINLQSQHCGSCSTARAQTQHVSPCHITSHHVSIAPRTYPQHLV
jgi:hypothetical protein